MCNNLFNLCLVALRNVIHRVLIKDTFPSWKVLYELHSSFSKVEIKKDFLICHSLKLHDLMASTLASITKCGTLLKRQCWETHDLSLSTLV